MFLKLAKHLQYHISFTVPVGSKMFVVTEFNNKQGLVLFFLFSVTHKDMEEIKLLIS